jgi:ribosome biogenesis protein Tsr3
LSQHTVPAERAKQDKQMTRNMGIKILASSWGTIKHSVFS